MGGVGENGGGKMETTVKQHQKLMLKNNSQWHKEDFIQGGLL